MNSDVSTPTQSVIPFLHALASTGGSDLHCKVGSAPRVRVDGRLRKLQVPELTPADTERMLEEVLPDDLVARVASVPDSPRVLRARAAAAGEG